MKKPHSSTQIDAPGERKDLLDEMVELAASNLGAEFCAAISLNPLKGTFHKSAISSAPLPKSLARKQLPPWMDAMVRESIESKTPQFVKIPSHSNQNLPQDSILRTLKHLAVLPLFTKRERKAIAILFLGYAAKARFTEEDHIILTYISERFEPLLEGAWLLGRYQKVIAAGQKINQELQAPEAIVKQLYKQISGVLDTSYYIALSVYNPQSRTFGHHRYYRGEYTQADGKFMGASAYVIETAKPFITSHYSEDVQLYGNNFPKIVQAYDDATPLAESMIFIPLFYQKEPLGVLSIQHDKPRAFDEEDIRIIKLLGNQVVLALNYLRLLYYMEKINESGKRLIQPLSTRANLLKEVTDHILQVTKASIVVLYSYQHMPNRPTQDCFLKGVESGQLLHTGNVKQKVRSDDIANLALKRALETEDAELWIEDSKTLYEKLGGDPKTRKGDFESREEIKSTAVLVLRAGEEAVGVLFLNYRVPQTFDSLQQLLITTLAYFAAIAIKNHQALQVLHSKDFSVLQRIDQKIGQTFDIADIMETLLKLAVKHISADDAVVYLYDKRSNSLKAASTRGTHEELYRDSVIELSMQNGRKPKGLVASAFFKRTPVLSDNVRRSRVYKEVVPTTRSELDVPFIDPVTREAIGVINLESGTPSAFSLAHRDFMVVLAGQAVVAIRNAQIYGRVRNLTSSVEALRHLSKKVVSTQESPKEAFEAILETARKLFNVEMAVLQLYDMGLPSESYIVKDTTPEVYEKIKRILPHKNKLGIIKYVAKTRKYFLTNDTQNEKHYRGTKIIRSELAVPLIFEDALIGVLDLESINPSIFTEDDVSLLELFAAQAVLVVQSARRLLEARLEVEVERRRLELLNAATDELNRINEPEQVDAAYGIVVSKVSEFKKGEILLRRYVAEKREFHLVTTPVNPYEAAPLIVPEAGSWNGRAKREHQVIAEQNLDDLPPEVPRPIAGDLVKSIVIAPIEFADSYYGNLITGHKEPNFFDVSDVNLLKVLATQLAITLKRLEIIKAVRDTEESNREMSILSSVGQVAINLSHDLSTALAPVKLSAATLLNLLRQNMPRNKPRKAEIIARAEAEFERINERMRRAKDFAQDMKSTFNLAKQDRAEPEIISVNMLLEEVGLKYKGDQRARLVLSVPPDIGTIKVSQARIKQVFDHLISNAKEAMKGRGTITVSVSRSPQDVIISVADTGPGIKSSLLETIFQLGYTTKMGGRRKGMGFGFGLWYARQIVEDYEGTLKAKNRRERGATFIITLPLTNKRSAF